MYVILWFKERWVDVKLLARNFVLIIVDLYNTILRSSFKFLDSNWLFIYRLKIYSWPCLCRLDIYLKYSKRDFLLQCVREVTIHPHILCGFVCARLAPWTVLACADMLTALPHTTFEFHNISRQTVCTHRFTW